LLRSTRPTAVNLGDRTNAQTAYETIASVEQLKQVLLKTAQMINAEDCKLSSNRRSRSGSLPTTQKKLSILTTATALATAGYGTALGVVRPLGERVPAMPMKLSPLTGCKLTAWECVQEGIQSP